MIAAAGMHRDRELSAMHELLQRGALLQASDVAEGFDAVSHLARSSLDTASPTRM